MEDDVIRLYVGEILEDKNSQRWLISKMWPNRIYSFIRLSDGFIKVCRLDEFKRHLKTGLKRIGILKGIELLEGEDWLCHDNRCLPRILAGSCQGCLFSGLVKERKRYFEPGDIVWIPSMKKKSQVLEASLFYLKNNVPLEFINDQYLMLHHFNSFSFSVRFRLEAYPYPHYYRWDQIRLVKRKRHFINPSQLDHMCNDLCLFGPYSKHEKNCFECETGKIWRTI